MAKENIQRKTPDPSVRALLRYHLKGRYGGNIEWSEHEAGEWVRFEDLAAHFAKLADLAAEMQRFAEATEEPYSDERADMKPRAIGKQVLAWVARLKALQE